MVVLIWMVQLIVYPGFLYYSKEELQRWHGPYTSAITIIVMPLMVGQLLLHSSRVFRDFNYVHLATLLLVISTWVVTFLVSVPLHNKIAAGTDFPNATQQLVSTNWIRTFQWTVIFLIGLLGSSKDAVLF